MDKRLIGVFINSDNKKITTLIDYHMHHLVYLELVQIIIYHQILEWINLH